MTRLSVTRMRPGAAAFAGASWLRTESKSNPHPNLSPEGGEAKAPLASGEGRGDERAPRPVRGPPLTIRRPVEVAIGRKPTIRAELRSNPLWGPCRAAQARADGGQPGLPRA